MTTSRNLAGFGTVAAQQQDNRNLLYNGAMQVAQRGTSVAGITTAGGYHTADRWVGNVTNLGTWTQSVENDAPTGSGLRKSLKMLCTTADASPASTDLVRVDQYLEGQDLQRIAKGTASAQQLTLSFWVKTNVTGTYIVELVDVDNTRNVSASYTVAASATWERKTITFPADTTGAFDNDNALSLRVCFGLGAGPDLTGGTLQTTWATPTNANRYVGQTNLASATNNYWQVTGVQLETGVAATPFEFKSYGQELRECQRYYEKSYQQSIVPGTANQGEGCVIHFIDGLNSATRTLFYTVNYKVTKRTSAPLVAYSTVTGTANKVRDINATADVNALYSVYSDSSAVVYWTNGAGQTSFNNQFQWVASAEL